MKIYNNRKFLFRLFLSVVCIILIVIPIIWGCNPSEKDLKEFGNNKIFAFFMVTIMGFIFEALAIGLVFGIYKLCSYAWKNKIIKRWLYWLCAVEDADNFLKKL